MNTPQETSVALANMLCQIMGMLAQVIDTGNVWNNDYNQANPDAIWQKMPTAATNLDGTIGAADGTPDTTHLITAPTGAPLNRSRNDLLNGKLLIDDFRTWVVGQSNSVPRLKIIKTLRG